MGDSESLQILLKPFVNSSDQDDYDTSVDVIVDNTSSSAHAAP